MAAGWQQLVGGTFECKPSLHSGDIAAAISGVKAIQQCLIAASVVAHWASNMASEKIICCKGQQ